MFMKIIVIGIQGTGVDLFAGCLQVIQRIFQNLQEGKIQIFISQLPELVQMRSLISPWFDIISNEYNLVQRTHMRLAGGMAGDGGQDFFISDAIIRAGQPGADWAMAECVASFLAAVMQKAGQTVAIRSAVSATPSVWR